MYADILSVLTALVGMGMDLKKKKIANQWILFSMAAGYMIRLYAGGIKILPDAAGGMILPVLLLGWLFVFRMLGAGDIKTLSALGVCLGVRKILKCMIWSFLAGGVISLVLVLTRCSLPERLRYMGNYIRTVVHTGRIQPYSCKGENHPENFSFMVPVFLAVILTVAGG